MNQLKEICYIYKVSLILHIYEKSYKVSFKNYKIMRESWEVN